MRTRKSWRQKLADDKGQPRVEKITPRMSSRRGRGTVVMAASREVDALMRRVPAGKLTTVKDHENALISETKLHT